MDESFIGRRGPGDEEWTWEAEPPRKSPARGTRRRPYALAIAGIALLSAGVLGLLFALSTGTNGGADSATTPPVVAESPSPSPPPVASASPSPSGPSPSPSPPSPATATPTPLPGTAASMAWWDRTDRRWREGALDAGQYAEGDALPVLLHLEKAKPGAVYAIAIRYSRCDEPLGSSFDFLSDAYAGTAGAPPAPPRTERDPPDATVGIPDDPTIDLDEAGGERLFRLWGGTFEMAPQGPLTVCPDGRATTLNVRARSPNVFLMWAAHPASSSDWPGAGAAGRRTSFGLTVRVSAVQEVSIEVSPGAISR